MTNKGYTPPPSSPVAPAPSAPAPVISTPDVGLPPSQPELALNPPTPQTPFQPNTLAGSGLDFFTQRGTESPQVPRYQNTIVSKEIRAYDPFERRMKGTGVWESVVVIYDFYDGLNATWGAFPQTSNRLSSSELWTHVPGHVMLPYASTSASTTFANPIGVHHANIFSNMAIGVGDKLFSATTGQPSARTFTVNGGSITCLSSIILGGNTNANRLMVGCSSGVGEILSDLGATPTSDGDMNAATNPLWGHIFTGIYDSTTSGFINLLYYGNSIGTLTTAQAIGTAPTTTSTVFSGGYAIGASNCEGSLRAYWAIPKQTTTAGILATTGQVRTPLHFIYSTTLEGTEPVKCDFQPANGVRGAGLDGDDIVFWEDKEFYIKSSGRPKRAIGIFRDRETIVPSGGVAAAPTYQVRGYRSDGVYLYILTHRTSGSLSSYFGQWQIYNKATGALHGFSAEEAMGAASGLPWILPAGGTMPYSQDGLTHYYAYDTGAGSSQAFVRQPVPAPNNNPMFLREAAFEAGPKTLKSTAWTLPGFIGVPSVVESIEYGGYMNSVFGVSGNGNSSVAVSVGSQGKDAPSQTGVSMTLSESDRVENRYRYFGNNRDYFTYLQLTLSATRETGGTVNATPNCVPLVLRILSFPNRDVRTPNEVRGR